KQGRDQRAADLAALAGARAMRSAYYGLFEPPTVAGGPNPRHVEKGEYLARGRRAALATAARNDARAVTATFPDAREIAPVRIRNGWPRRGTRCIGWPPSSTWARPAPTAGSTPIRGSSGSSNAMPGSRGTLATR